MQKIWVCGARGQIGQAVNDVVDKLEFEMLDTDVDDLDVTDTDEVLRFGEMNRPDIIINCSGMTAACYILQVSPLMYALSQWIFSSSRGFSPPWKVRPVSALLFSD